MKKPAPPFMKRFSILCQFPMPDDISIITRVCPFCQVMNGQRCKSDVGKPRGFHMARIMDALGYGRVGRRELYVWKTGPFAKDIIKP